MTTRELVIRLLVAWGVGAGAGFLLLFLSGVVVLLLALAPVGTIAVLVVWAAYLLLTGTALVGAVAAAVVLWESGPSAPATPRGLARTHRGAHVPHGLVAVPGAAVAVLVARPVLSPGVVLEIPVLVEALAGAALAVAVVPAVVATVSWARARRRGPSAPPSPA